jgi:hypothetical protein
MSDKYNPSDFPLPEGFSFSKYKLNLDESTNKIACTIPVFFTWTRELVTPEVDEATNVKKWSVSCAIPKEASEAVVAEARKLCDAMMKADGNKTGAYPHFMRDGAAKDSSGMFIRSGGRLQEYYYFTAKTRNLPKVLQRVDGDLIPAESLDIVYSGGYGFIAGSIIPISYGDSSSKRGTSFWFNKILFAGGGKALGSAGRSDEDDFGDVFSSGTTKEANSFF